MRRLLRLLRAVSIAGLVIASLMLNFGTAYAGSCSGYCVFAIEGVSGTGALGTGTNLWLPDSVTTYNTQDTVAGAAFLYHDRLTAIEAGIAYGYTTVCGSVGYFHPYGTIQNGNTEQDNCSYVAQMGGQYQVQAFVHNSSAFSFFNSQSGTPIWAVNWGSYVITGQNLTQAEVHANSDHPDWRGSLLYLGEQWYDGVNWNNWGYTNVTNNACPDYWGGAVSSTSWAAYDTAC